MIIICENAINYDSMDQAKLMILKAKEITERTGVKTLSKFQLFSEKEVVNKEHLEYCKERMLTFKQAKSLYDYGVSIGQTVFFTPMATQFVDWIEKIGCKYIKIRFYDRYNKELCGRALDLEKTLFISTNERYYWDNTKTLFCVPKYPALYSDYSGINFNHFDGVSDHTGGVLLLKTLLQKKYSNKVKYFEKHMILDGFQGLENKWSVSFKELEEVLKK